jgi:Tfp pilus assembly protein PilO|tara:strand:- start:912 stop:1550 length:639 start_codon:yes stop_codon:yes gene_type:complete
MDLKNITVEDLKEKFAAFDKKTLIKFGIGIGAIILFLIIYFAILRPMVNEKKATLDDQINKQMEIQQFENDIITIKNRIKKMEPIVEKNSTLFHSKAEVEGLYDSLSRYAGAYGLVISKIQKQKPQPVLKSGVAAQAQELLDQSMVSYYKIPVDYEIKGNFLNYIKFKRAVSRSKKMLNFDKELINVVQNDPNGAVVASGELTIVGLPNEFF